MTTQAVLLLALLDSVNPSAIVVTLYLLANGGARAPVKVLVYVGAIFVTYSALGAALLLGIGALLPSLGGVLRMPAGLVAQCLVGLREAGPLLHGRLSVRSGVDAAEILRVDGASEYLELGYDLAALGDVDGDGRADLAVSAPASFLATAPGFVRAISGANGATLWQRDPSASDARPGVRLAAFADLDQDGVRELAVAEQLAPLSSAVHVLDGASGALLYTIHPPAGAGGAFGDELGAAGDFDADGKIDLAVGDPSFANSTGRVTVHSGRNGVLLASFDGPSVGASFGATLAHVGDVDADGVPDLFVGAPFDTRGPLSAPGPARLVSGASGATLLLLEAVMNQVQLANRVGRYPDLDGDGHDELALSGGLYRFGCCSYSIASLHVFSSASGALLYTAHGQASDRFVVLPDASGDGQADFLLPGHFLGLLGYTASVVAPGLEPPVSLWAPQCPTVAGSHGCDAYLSFVGAPSTTMGDPFQLVAGLLPPSTVGLFAWSKQTASIPFGGGTLCLAAPLRRSPLFSASSNGFGCGGGTGPTGTIRWAFPDHELIQLGLVPGEQLFFQALYRDPGLTPPSDFGLTNALTVTLWP